MDTQVWNDIPHEIWKEIETTVNNLLPELNEVTDNDYLNLTLNESRVIELTAELLSRIDVDEPLIHSQILNIFEQYQTDLGIRFRSNGPRNSDSVTVPRTAIIALLVTVIGASAGYVTPSLSPIVTGMVSAHTAILLNVLASHIFNFKKPDIVFGMDAAVMSILACGHYTTEEISARIGASVTLNDVNAAVEGLQSQGLIKEGQWQDTYSI